MAKVERTESAMEFTVKQSDLVCELAIARGAVEKKTTLPILANVLVEAAGDLITLTATDLELSIRCQCPARVKREGSWTMPARKLLDYLKLLPDGDVACKVGDGQWASFVSGRSRMRLAGMSRESFPEMPAVPDPVGEIPSGALAIMVSRTLMAISREESRFTLNGALLVLRADGLAMVTTDGHRLAFALCGNGGAMPEGFRMLIPHKALIELSHLCAEAGATAPVSVASDENHLFFEVAGRVLTARKLSGNFPDYERVLPQDAPHRASMTRQDLSAALARSMQFADETSHAVRVQFAADGVKVISASVETGESEEGLDCEYGGPDLEIGFNGSYLQDFLRGVTTDQVEMWLTDAKSAGELRPAGDPGYRYVVMPMRV